MNRDDDSDSRNISPARPSGGGRAARGGDIYQGKWTPEEEKYAQFLIEEFKVGNLSISKETTLRAFLAKQLNCLPKRISKKFENSGYRGKSHYQGKSVQMSARESQVRAFKLQQLREDFIASRSRAISGKTGASAPPQREFGGLGQGAHMVQPSPLTVQANPLIQQQHPSLVSTSMERRLQETGLYRAPPQVAPPAAASTMPVFGQPDRTVGTPAAAAAAVNRLAAMEQLRSEMIASSSLTGRLHSVGGAATGSAFGTAGLGTSMPSLLEQEELRRASLLEEELRRSRLMELRRQSVALGRSGNAATGTSLSHLSMPGSLLPPSASINRFAMAAVSPSSTGMQQVPLTPNLNVAVAEASQRGRSLLEVPPGSNALLPPLMRQHQVDLEEGSGTGLTSLSNPGLRSNNHPPRAAAFLPPSLHALDPPGPPARGLLSSDNPGMNTGRGKRRNSAPSGDLQSDQDVKRFRFL